MKIGEYPSLCPKCGGSGKMTPKTTTTVSYWECDMCAGSGIVIRKSHISSDTNSQQDTKE